MNESGGPHNGSESPRRPSWRSLTRMIRTFRYDWFFRLVYLVCVLAVTLPIVFHALAAYQFQVKATEVAERTGLDVELLISRAAIWNGQMRDWADLAQTLAPEARARSQVDASGELGTDEPAAIDTEVVQAFKDALAGLRACGMPVDGACEDGVPVLASQLNRFDRLALPAWFPLYDRPSVLAELPGWTLTLVVTLVAGVLGSLIFVLKVLLRQLLDNWSTGTTGSSRPRPWSWLILRPVFGVVVAFGAYVALQSGLMVFDGAMSVAPSAYVTAAVGLIAGLLSWHVIETIERAGARWLNRQRPRWGYGLKSHATNRGLEVGDLAKRLEVAKQLMEDWIDVRIPVPPDQANRLAAELNVDPEELFQSVPPWQRNNAGPGQDNDGG